MSVSRFSLLVLLAVALSSCEAVTSPITELDAPVHRQAATDTRLDASEALTAWAGRRVAVCHAAKGTSTYRRVLVPQPAVRAHLRHGDELAGGAVLNERCEPIPPPSSCACFAGSDLDTPLAGTAPQPYIFSDVFNYFNEDNRRTEVRSTLSTEFGLLEEVAAVYITATGDAAAPLAPLCFRQDAVLDAMTETPTYTYTTREISIGEAEACRLDIEAFADGQQACQGGACDIPYSEDQLDPAYPPYHDGGYRTPDSVLDAMQARIATVRAQLTLQAL